MMTKKSIGYHHNTKFLTSKAISKNFIITRNKWQLGHLLAEVMVFTSIGNSSKSLGKIQKSENRYKSMTSSFVTQAFRKLQNFVEQICEHSVKRCNRIQTKKMFTILLNCRKTFIKKVAQTFLKFITLNFNQQCTGIAVTKTEAVNFYEQAKQLLKKKMTPTSPDAQNLQCPFPINSTTLDENIASQESFCKTKKSSRLQLQRCQDNLVDIYIGDPRFGVAKDRYAALYGYNVKYSTTGGVQTVIFKMIRRTIKKMQDLHKQYYGKISPLVILNDYKIKRILTNTQAARIRVKLLQFYKIKEPNLQNLRQMTEAVNHHVKQRDQDEEENAKPGMAAYYRKYSQQINSKNIKDLDPQRELMPQIFIGKAKINQMTRR